LKKQGGYSVTVAWDTSSIQEWFDPTIPLKMVVINSELANRFRKRFVKGFIIPGGNNLYIGACTGNLLFGVLGFSVPDYCSYDLLMKADTTPSDFKKSTDLLLFMLRTNECSCILERKFNRKIDGVYSMCFSSSQSIGRYRKHGDLITKKEILSDGQIVGYNLGYLFKMNTIVSLKEAKAQFIQKSWKK